MEKYYRIGEISKLYGIGVDSLRYYEELGIISPERSSNNYRLYSLNDIWKLNVIRELRSIGFSLETIKEYLSSHTVNKTMSLLLKEKEAIKIKLKELKKLQEVVNLKIETINRAINCPLEEIVLKEFKERKYFSISEGYNNEKEMDVLIKKLLNINKDKFYVIGNNQIGSMLNLKDGNIKYNSVFIIDESGKEILKPGKYLSVTYKGDYKKSKKLIEKLYSYAEKNNLKTEGDILELLWIDIHTTNNIEEHITELQLRIL